VFATRALPQAAADLLASETDLEVWPDYDRPPREVLLSRARECTALLTTVEDRVDAEVLAAGQGTLKVVANFAVGFDNLDVASATRHGVAMSNTPEVLTKTTADLAFALIMAAARRVVEGYLDVRQGKWRNWHPFAYVGQDVHGATLSILGLGQIGLEVVKRALGFDMMVFYYDPVRRWDEEERYGLTYCEDVPSALKVADFVSVHTPLTPQTRHLIGRQELGMMKPTAILVNTARGAIVDNEALYEALRDGVIAGAGLDVTDPEPIPMDHPLLTLPNVVITPHIGSATMESRTEMAMLAARNILACLRGEEMPTGLNPEVFRKG
jgi:glyoxylate reductase